MPIDRRIEVERLPSGEVRCEICQALLFVAASLDGRVEHKCKKCGWLICITFRDSVETAKPIDKGGSIE